MFFRLCSILTSLESVSKDDLLGAALASETSSSISLSETLNSFSPFISYFSVSLDVASSSATNDVVTLTRGNIAILDT
ncbi:hypothetical protein EE612_050566 [Oryza sativa]|nr:hypothetical protein EE612_050566 [Oryza sativa]